MLNIFTAVINVDHRIGCIEAAWMNGYVLKCRAEEFRERVIAILPGAIVHDETHPDRWEIEYNRPNRPALHQEILFCPCMFKGCAVCSTARGACAAADGP